MSVEPQANSGTTASLRDRPIGLILAGGQARRMNGADKASVNIAGRPMIARVAARLIPQCAELIVSANEPSLSIDARWPRVSDPADLSAFAGPLAGVLAALDWIAANRPDATGLLTSPVDAPFLPTDLAERLKAASASNRRSMAVARSGGRMHPVFALWDIGLRAALRHALVHDGLRKIGLWMTQQRAAEAIWDTQPFDPFFNVNTPDDAVEASRLTQQHAQLA
jgi:molybdenum cofactor guanylyltransferase